ncbi:TonB-dependent receptor [Niabella hibiscisoli]|uniref:TonB-dependent receptor n=1 Tax=Niabella hibiscisoli TaxID=1825928 RepID=UPI001F1177C1|nr:TonB-dependent receptor plug domain-containing protein [Niabella hibiscisoli]MCH5717354.1 TonB-dependent receptor [Niabella hibiscisoli]
MSRSSLANSPLDIRYLVVCLLLSVPLWSAAQVTPVEAGQVLAEDTVFAEGRFDNAMTAAVVKKRLLEPPTNKATMLNLINTVPGVRMEERSPGSYRLNMRGSALRSPFGVRNVKIYWNDIPLTDPGGNTYFNQLTLNSFSDMTFVKSTANTSYGAGTGGQVLIRNRPLKNKRGLTRPNRGSYQLKGLFASGTLAGEKMASRVSYSHNETDGYRDQSAMRRDHFSLSSEFNISDKQQLSAHVLFTDMYYQTPGGLTLSEFQTNPRSARPAAGIFPSAINAKAAIFQRNFTAGIGYKNSFNSVFSNSTTIYGSYNRIENSAVRNYEMRNEPHFGARTIFKLDKKYDNGNHIDWQNGAELQSGNFNIKVSGNKLGVADTLQTNDDVQTTVYSVFSQLVFATANKWSYSAGLSYNKNRIAFERLSDYPVLNQPFSFSTELIPRFAVSKAFGGNNSIGVLASKSFSPPTIAELLPSTGIINTSLQAEKGWNYELIGKIHSLPRLQMEASVFAFRLKDALVQRRDESGADYFTNAGGARQNGVELFTGYNYVRRSSFIETGWLTAAYTYSHFRYAHFEKDGNDFSGKTLPGVPSNTFSIWGDAYLRNGFYLIGSYYSASAIFLNDANTVSASPYHLVAGKIGYVITGKKLRVDFYVGEITCSIKPIAWVTISRFRADITMPPRAETIMRERHFLTSDKIT